MSAVYANSFGGVFVFDDFPSIVHNAFLRDLTQPLHWVTAPPDTTMAGRPLGAFSVALTVWLGGREPWPFHLGNLLLHAANTLLVFGIARRLFTRAAIPLAGGPTRAAFFTALLWALHPVQTNAVTYIIQRAESLMALGLLSATYAFLRANDPPARHATPWLALAVLSTFLGILSKETAVVAPLLLLLIDRAWFQPTFHSALTSRPVTYGGLFSSWILLGWLVLGGHRTESVGFTFDTFPWWRYLLEQGPIILTYLKLLPYPSPLIFAAYLRDDTSIWALIPSALLVALLGLGSLWLYRKRPRLGLAPILFLLILAPTSSILPIVTEPYAEHRLYLASFPLIALAVWASARWAALHPTANRGRSLAIVGVALALVLATLTFLRNSLFHDPAALWADVVQKQPFNAKAWNNLGEALAARNQLDPAGDAFTAALRAQPQNYIAAFNLGVLRARQARHQEAIDAYQLALKTKPDFPPALASAAHSLIQLNRLSEAAYVLAQALALDPFHPVALLNLAAVQSAQGQPEAARRTVQKLIRHHPDDPRARALAQSLGLSPGD
ncbi:MAG: tetratricopeptide repeat protein [Verrucomicrobiia bacterium]